MSEIEDIGGALGRAVASGVDVTDLRLLLRADVLLNHLVAKGQDLILALCGDKSWNKETDEAVCALQALINEATKARPCVTPKDQRTPERKGDG